MRSVARRDPKRSNALGPDLAIVAACALLNEEALASRIDVLTERLGDEWDRFLATASYHGVDRLACSRLSAVRPGLFPARVESEIQSRSIRAAALHALQTSLTCRVLAHLEGNGVPALVLKGAGVSYLLYSESPELRSSWDIDILVPPDAFDAAGQRLSEMGLQRSWPLTDPKAKARPMLLTLANVFDFRDPTLGLTVELHCRPTLNPYAFPVDFARLYADSALVRTPHGVLRTLDGPTNIAYLSHHALSEMVFRLKWFGDIARAERRAGEDCAKIVVRDDRLPSRPAERVSEVLRLLEAGVEGALTSRANKKVEYVLRSMERQIEVPVERSLARLPLEVVNLRFVVSLLPGWRARAYEILRLTSDPRDAATLGLSPWFSPLYVLVGPFLAAYRYLARALSRERVERSDRLCDGAVRR